MKAFLTCTHTYRHLRSTRHCCLHTPAPHPPSHRFLFMLLTSLLCCVSVRSAAPDLHKLNEDGELWLVNQGLKETIRCNQSVISEHDAFAFSQDGMGAVHVFALSHFKQPFSIFSHIYLYSSNQTAENFGVEYY